jgi:TonB family protein
MENTYLQIILLFILSRLSFCSTDNNQSFPILLRYEEPKYTDSMLKHNIEGEIKVNLLIDTNGNVANYIITNDLGYGSKESVKAIINKMKFKPAEMNGKPYPMLIPYTFKFKQIKNKYGIWYLLYPIILLTGIIILISIQT